MSSLTTFGIGGRALVLYPNSLIQLDKAITICSKNKIKFFYLGNGSKLLCGDNLDNIVFIKLGEAFSYVKAVNKFIICGGGTLTPKVASIAKSYSLGGAEFFKCLPASVGGAIIMNAGCYGQECSHIVSKVWATNGRRHICINNKNMLFSYRSSKLKGSCWAIYKAEFSLAYVPSQQIEQLTVKMQQSKRKSQPLSQRSCGSIFLRKNGIIPAIFIEKAGLKGLRIGGAQVSDIHSNFIVNNSNATAKDVLLLIAKIKAEIYTKYSVKLEEEVIYISDQNI